MKIKEALYQENARTNALMIAQYAVSSKKRFAELMNCFFSNDPKLASRASWSVALIADSNTNLVAPYFEKMILQLDRADIPESVIRHTVRILEGMEIPEYLQGHLMNSCFSFIEKPTTKPAIKAFSLTVLFNLSKIYHDIQPELALIIEELWDVESPAFKSRGRKILKALKKNAPDSKSRCIHKIME
jgi:hypothetical protein